MLTRVFTRLLLKNSTNVKPITSKVYYCRSFCTTQNNALQTGETLSDQQIKEITDGKDELEKKIRLLLMEFNFFKYENARVPSLSVIRKVDWLELCGKKSKNERLKYYSYLFKTEKNKENAKIKKANLAEKVVKLKEERKAELDEHVKLGKPMYTLLGNTMFLRIYEQTIMELYNYKLIQALTFGQKIVFDCSFDDTMSRKETINCAKQLMLAFSSNRYHVDPFDLHFCNVNFDKLLMKELNKFIKPMRESWFPLQFHTQSYLDIFPKKNLVYLTPNCRTPLNEYNHDDVYIIGSIVDKSREQPLTLTKAKSEGLRMANLPLDKYLIWGCGSSKSLTLEQVIRILLDVKHTNDWSYSMRHVPRRKIFENQKQNFDMELRKKISEIKKYRRESYKVLENSIEI